MTLLTRIVLAAAIGFLPMAALSEETDSDYSDRYYQLREQIFEYTKSTAELAIPDDPDQIAALFEEAYPGLIGLLEVRKVGPTRNHLEVVGAIDLYHFYAQTEKSAQLLTTAASLFSNGCESGEVENGCDRSPFFVQKAYDALVDTQQFTEARSFAEAYSPGAVIQWDTSPFRERSGTSGILGFSSVDGELQPSFEEIQPASGYHLVAAVSPTCGPSVRALEWIEANARSAPNLLSIRYLNSPRNIRENSVRILEFNENSSLVDIEVAIGREGWPGSVSFEQTPIFYVLKDGAVVDKLVGWPSDEQGLALLQLIGPEETEN